MKLWNFQRNDDSYRSGSFLVAASTSCRLCLHRSRVNKRLPKGLPGIRTRLGERFSSLSAGSSLVRDIQRQASSGLAPLGVSLWHVKDFQNNASDAAQVGSDLESAWRGESDSTSGAVAMRDALCRCKPCCVKARRPTEGALPKHTTT